MLVDAVEGRIEYVLLALPPAGLRRVRYVTVPWSVFADAEEVEGRCHIRVRREALERMPTVNYSVGAIPGPAIAELVPGGRSVTLFVAAAAAGH